jgi:hypothetical protein
MHEYGVVLHLSAGSEHFAGSASECRTNGMEALRREGGSVQTKMIERFSKVFAAARGRIEIKLPANFGEKLTSAIP